MPASRRGVYTTLATASTAFSATRSRTRARAAPASTAEADEPRVLPPEFTGGAAAHGTRRPNERSGAEVHLDVGLTTHFLGANGVGAVRRSLELAPFAKVLYSSDAAGPAELHHLGARLWRDGMAAVLGGWVERGEWSAADAARVATMVGRDNARRVYRLDDAVPSGL